VSEGALPRRKAAVVTRDDNGPMRVPFRVLGGEALPGYPEQPSA